MPRLSVSKALGLSCAAALLAAAAAASAAPTTLRFEDAFSSRRPVSLHYEARFAATPATEGTVEVWRDGDVRIKRRTGDAIESYAVRAAHDVEYDLTVLDLHRKLLTRIARTNLYRLGNFTEWFDLSHALRHPKGAYRLVAARAPASAGTPAARCTWYDLEQQGRIVHICWSSRAQLPMRIVEASGRTVWNVTRLDLGPVPESVFRVEAHDFVQVDANQDVEKD